MSSSSADSVVVAFYANVESAVATLEAVQGWRDRSRAWLVDGAVVRVAFDGEHLELIARLSGKDEVSRPANALDEILPDGVLNLGALGASPASAMPHFLEIGLEINLLKEIGENLPPGGAAVLLVVQEEWYSDLARKLEGSSDIERYTMRRS